MAVVVTEHKASHAQRRRGSGGGREGGQGGQLVTERLRDKVIAEQKRREARPLGTARRLHQLRSRAHALSQESKPKRVRMHHTKSPLPRHPLCGRPPESLFSEPFAERPASGTAAGRRTDRSISGTACGYSMVLGEVVERERLLAHRCGHGRIHDTAAPEIDAASQFGAFAHCSDRTFAREIEGVG